LVVAAVVPVELVLLVLLVDMVVLERKFLLQDRQHLLVRDLLVLVVQELKWDGLVAVVVEHHQLRPQQHRLEELKVEVDLLVLGRRHLLLVVVREDMVEAIRLIHL